MNGGNEEEVLELMIDGGERLCDYALDKWMGDHYHLGEDMRQQMLKEWGANRRGIRPLANRIKSALKSGTL